MCQNDKKYTDEHGYNYDISPLLALFYKQLNYLIHNDMGNLDEVEIAIPSQDKYISINLVDNDLDVTLTTDKTATGNVTIPHNKLVTDEDIKQLITQIEEAQKEYDESHDKSSANLAEFEKDKYAYSKKLITARYTDYLFEAISYKLYQNTKSEYSTDYEIKAGLDFVTEWEDLSESITQSWDDVADDFRWEAPRPVAEFTCNFYIL